jgi:hypothetical protein
VAARGLVRTGVARRNRHRAQLTQRCVAIRAGGPAARIRSGYHRL